MKRAAWPAVLDKAAKGIPLLHAEFGVKVSICDSEKYKQAQSKSFCTTPATNLLPNRHRAALKVLRWHPSPAKTRSKSCQSQDFAFALKSSQAQAVDG